VYFRASDQTRELASQVVACQEENVRILQEQAASTKGLKPHSFSKYTEQACINRLITSKDATVRWKMLGAPSLLRLLCTSPFESKNLTLTWYSLFDNNET
jgi:hypothetical protein